MCNIRHCSGNWTSSRKGYIRTHCNHRVYMECTLGDENGSRFHAPQPMHFVHVKRPKVVDVQQQRISSDALQRGPYFNLRKQTVAHTL